MSTEADVRQDALGDSEATLRQAEAVLTDLDGTSPELPNENGVPDGDIELPVSGFREFIRALVQTYAEMAGVIESLRSSRGVLEQAASQRLKQTHESLAEVSSATETAATAILDGLDRALELVDQLDPETSGGAAAVDPSDHASRLRDELHQMMGLVQFQDITAQQLGHASSVLQDIEARLIALSDFFDVRGLGLEELITTVNSSIVEPEEPEGEAQVASCDPGASTLNAEARQTVADEIFTSL